MSMQRPQLQHKLNVMRQIRTQNLTEFIEMPYTQSKITAATTTGFFPRIFA